MASRPARDRAEASPRPPPAANPGGDPAYDFYPLLDPEAARRAGRPPVHFSEQDPWRQYRLRLHYAFPSARLTRPPSSADTTVSTIIADAAFGTCLALNRNGKITKLTVHKGVVWDRLSRSWRAKIKIKGRTWYLGLFKDVTAAAQAYDAAATFVMGKRAALNFPGLDYSDTAPSRPPPQWLMDYVADVERNQGLIMSSMARRYIAAQQRHHSLRGI